MTDRDTFAAAALTGLIAGPAAGPAQTFQEFASEAFRLADAMLRERGKTPAAYHENDEKRAVWPTNHDAAPAARVRTDADSDRTDKAALRPGEGTGETPQPHATQTQGSVQGDGTQTTLTDEERSAVEWAADHLDASGWSSERLRGLLERLA